MVSLYPCWLLHLHGCARVALRGLAVPVMYTSCVIYCGRNMVLSVVVTEQGNPASHCVKCSQLANKKCEKFSQDMTAAVFHFKKASNRKET